MILPELSFLIQSTVKVPRDFAVNFQLYVPEYQLYHHLGELVNILYIIYLTIHIVYKL